MYAHGELASSTGLVWPTLEGWIQTQLILLGLIEIKYLGPSLILLRLCLGVL